MLVPTRSVKPPSWAAQPLSAPQSVSAADARARSLPGRRFVRVRPSNSTRPRRLVAAAAAATPPLSPARGKEPSSSSLHPLPPPSRGVVWPRAVAAPPPSPLAAVGTKEGSGGGCCSSSSGTPSPLEPGERRLPSPSLFNFTASPSLANRSRTSR